MTRDRYGKVKARIPPFAAIPRAVIESDEFRELSGNTVKLLVYLAGQYRGANNGDLSTATLRKDKRWTSGRTLALALKEAREGNWLLLTRQGGKGIGPSLYALSWLPVDECKGKIDYPPEMVASDAWRKKAEPHCGANPGPTVGLMDPLKDAA
jgi:hypothetical protein